MNLVTGNWLLLEMMEHDPEFQHQEPALMMSTQKTATVGLSKGPCFPAPASSGFTWRPSDGWEQP